MKSGKRNAMTQRLLLIVIVFFTVLLLACRQEEQTRESLPQLVKTSIVGLPEQLKERVYPGRVIASKKVDLAFQVEGPLIELPIKEGMELTEGQLIARIDPRDFQNKVNEEEANLRKAKRDYLRAEKLLESGVIAESVYDEKKAAYEVTKSRLAVVKKALEDTYLRAPFTGLVANKYVDNYLNVRKKQAIISLQDVTDVDVLVDVPEQDIIHATDKKERYKKYVTFDALPGRRFFVKLKEYATESDPVTQTYKITLTMPAPTDVNILPGMTANLHIIPKDNAERYFLIPVEGTSVNTQGQYYVWIVNPSTTTVEKRIVQVGRIIDKNIVITSGLKIGDRIVIAGGEHLSENMKIKLYTTIKEAN